MKQKHSVRPASAVSGASQYKSPGKFFNGNPESDKKYTSAFDSPAQMSKMSHPNHVQNRPFARKTDSLKDNSSLPPSTTRALDPDYRFHNGFMLEKPASLQDAFQGAADCNDDHLPDYIRHDPAENLNALWNFKAPQYHHSWATSPANVPQTKNNIACDQSTNSNGSINNIKRVFQKASASRGTNLPLQKHKHTDRNHKHSNEQLAQRFPDGKKLKSTSVSQSTYSKKLSDRFYVPKAALARGSCGNNYSRLLRLEFCESCLFENESCAKCVREVGYTPATRSHSEKNPASQYQWAPRSLGAIKANTRVDSVLPHLRRGEFCDSCLFENDSCDSCKKECGRLPPDHQQHQTQWKPVSKTNYAPFNVVKTGPPQLEHLKRFQFCASCLLENDSCDACKVEFGLLRPKIQSTSRTGKQETVFWRNYRQNEESYPAHIRRLQFCESCLFEKEACSSCKLEYGPLNFAKTNIQTQNTSSSQNQTWGNNSRASSAERKQGPVSPLIQTFTDYTDDARFSPEEERLAALNSRVTGQHTRPFNFWRKRTNSPQRHNGQWRDQVSGYKTKDSMGIQQQSFCDSEAPSMAMSQAIFSSVPRQKVCQASQTRFDPFSELKNWGNEFPKAQRERSPSYEVHHTKLRDQPESYQSNWVNEVESGPMPLTKTYLRRTKDSNSGDKSKSPKHYY